MACARWPWSVPVSEERSWVGVRGSLNGVNQILAAGPSLSQWAGWGHLSYWYLLLTLLCQQQKSTVTAWLTPEGNHVLNICQTLRGDSVNSSFSYYLPTGTGIHVAFRSNPS